MEPLSEFHTQSMHLVLVTNMRLGLKCRALANALVYHDAKLITTVKSIKVPTPLPPDYYARVLFTAKKVLKP